MTSSRRARQSAAKKKNKRKLSFAHRPNTKTHFCAGQHHWRGVRCASVRPHNLVKTPNVQEKDE
jgi:hypothetical protein